MKLTLMDVATIANTTLEVVKKWRQSSGLPGGRDGKLIYVDSDDWKRWAAANLYRTSSGRMRKRNIRSMKRTGVVDSRYIADAVASTGDEHPVTQARRFARVSMYAARVEQGQPIFGEAC